MMKAYAESLYDKLHEKKPFHNGTFDKWGEKRTSETPFHYRDGVSLWIVDADLSPHDHFLGGASDCPECSGSPEQPDGYEG